ncbi:MAG: hypothetical protein L0H37_03480, partial [Nitrosospira sp.]|nr:hypothetical protein [Nitrosospira sp.]
FFYFFPFCSNDLRFWMRTSYKQNQRLVFDVVINHPGPTAFSATFCPDAYFFDAAAARYNVAALWIYCQYVGSH